MMPPWLVTCCCSFVKISALIIVLIVFGIWKKEKVTKGEKSSDCKKN